MADIGKIRWVAIREMWPREDADFTPWLRQNIKCLDDYLGLGLSNPREEEQAGALRVDIVADSDRGTVVIENQYGRSDHKHLGQLITYLAVQGTQHAIWIAEDPREEHIQAVNILNGRGIGAVWFVKVKGIRIDNSNPAPLFTVVAGPNGNIELPDASGLSEERGKKIYRFWDSLFNRARAEEMEIPHRNINPSTAGNLITPAIGGPEIMYILAVNQNSSRIMCQNRGGARLATYDHLARNQVQINEEFRASRLEKDLEWKDDRDKAGVWKIKYEVQAGYEDDSNWAAKMEELNRAAVALKMSLEPYLRNVPDDEAEELPDQEA